VNLVAVTAIRENDPRRARAALKLAPTTYYGNLRPFAWVIDLESGDLLSPRRPGQPEGRQQLREAADLTSSAVDLNVMFAAQERHGEQLQAFRRLVQGRQPRVTYLLIAANVAMFLVVSAAPGQYTSNLPHFGALIPERVLHGEWWRLLTAMFLHAGVAHILFNMISLFVVGSLAERLYGSLKFLAIYLGSGLIASLAGFAYSAATGDLLSPHVGASGAIFGIAGALMTMRFQRTDIVPLGVRSRISTSMLVLVVLNLVVLTFTPNIDNSAHIGGLLGGMALSFVFPLTRHIPNRVPR
jgi:rhomboid protease GluP